MMHFRRDKREQKKGENGKGLGIREGGGVECMEKISIRERSLGLGRPRLGTPWYNRIPVTRVASQV